MPTLNTQKRGVVQINFDCGYLNQQVADAEAKEQAELAPQLAEIRAKYKDNPEAVQKNLDIIKKYNPRIASMLKAYCKADKKKKA